MENNSFFNVNITYLRKKKGISQKELGEAIGKKNSVISAYEKGISSPSLEISKRIADFFGTTIDCLIKIDMSNNNQFLMEYSNKIESEYSEVNGEYEFDYDLFMKKIKAFKNIMNKIMDYDKLSIMEASIFSASNYFTYYHTNFTDKMFKDIEDDKPYIRDLKSFAKKYKEEIQSFKNLINTYSEALILLEEANKEFQDKYEFLDVYQLPNDF